MSNTEFKAGDKVKCIDTIGTENLFDTKVTYTVNDYNQGTDTVLISGINCYWRSDRFELIEKEKYMEKQFNPQSGHNVIASLQPGDKIICNNGEEFTCCTQEYLKEEFNAGMGSTKPIFGFTAKGVWQDWNADGTTHFDDFDYRIREVMPKQDVHTGFTFQKCNTDTASFDKQDATQEGYIELHRNEDGTLSALNVYTPEDIRKAVFDDLGWKDFYLDLIMKSLEKVTSKEYNEYLRLKGVFEPESE